MVMHILDESYKINNSDHIIFKTETSPIYHADSTVNPNLSSVPSRKQNQKKIPNTWRKSLNKWLDVVNGTRLVESKVDLTT